MRSRNIEFGIDAAIGNTKISVVGFWNRVMDSYSLGTRYSPYEYRMSSTPAGYVMPANPEFRIDEISGFVDVRDGDVSGSEWVRMDTGVINKSFARRSIQENNAPEDYMGVELTVDFGRVRAINTSFRLDAAYTHVNYLYDGLTYFYRSGLSHSNSAMTGRSYEFMGIYPQLVTTSGTYNGRKSDILTGNLTVVTNIPSIRMVISLRLQATLVDNYQNISNYKGRELAYKVADNNDPTPVDGSIYDRNSYSAIWPLMYMDTDGNIYNFTEESAQDPALRSLIILGGAYAYNKNGYSPWFSANLSITKEIGDMASISFYANNCTNTRRYLTEFSSGLKYIPTEDIYYGLTLRLKF
jgi:hypothetical protein